MMYAITAPKLPHFQIKHNERTFYKALKLLINRFFQKLKLLSLLKIICPVMEYGRVFLGLSDKYDTSGEVKVTRKFLRLLYIINTKQLNILI